MSDREPVPAAEERESLAAVFASGAPIRAELVTSEGLGERAGWLAGSQSVAVEQENPTPLLTLVREAGADLERQNEDLAVAAQAQQAVSPAAEWLLDNYYLIEEQVRTVKEDLPADYGVELPRLVSGPLGGYPRVFEAMLTLIAHTDGRVDEESLSHFLTGFQDVSPLSIGEVWAVPIMLRVALLEDLRRLGARVVRTQRDEYAADDWANRLLQLAARGRTEELASWLQRLEADRTDVDPAFLTRLSGRIRGEAEELGRVNRWVEERLASAHISLEEVSLALQREQASSQVSIANAITSIRFLDAYDWRSFFERTSVVEQILREDPAEVYGRMDFRSRDRYRHALEAMAKRTPLGEIRLAEALISTALEALTNDATHPLHGHVGYWLVSAGRYAFERSVQYRPRLRERVYRGPLSRRGAFYWGILALLTGLLEIAFGAFTIYAGLSPWLTVLLMVLAVIPFSDIVMNVVNRIATVAYPPRMLPKLDFRKPLSPAHRALVVVPALMSSPEATQRVIDNLEVAFLSNVDRNLHFALLGDLKAADSAHAEGDPAVLAAALNGIRELNTRYAPEYGFRPFHLYVRGRSYSETERRWMGWERKRGAIAELARALRGSTDTSFTHQLGEEAFCRDATFVITLDADTVLPRDAARKLVCCIAHPLNRAVFDADKGMVVSGYGLVQPRVGMSLPAASRSFFAWLYSGVTGVDPYVGAVSDTYQDVFGEGSFTGKGIFEVDVYNATLEGRFPEGTLLSHDLIEGSFLRTGLASDIEVLDEYPSSYAAQAARLHRWVRGDWQTLPWLFPVAPNGQGKLAPNPLSILHRWKIADNLRRSLVAPSLLLLVTVGWAVLPEGIWLWPLLLLAVTFFPAFFNAADSVLFRPREVGLGAVLPMAWQDFLRDTARGTLTMTMLPHEAWAMTDAILRALYRSRLSRRHMLEWETAADVEARVKGTLPAFVRTMWMAPLVAVLLLAPGALSDTLRLVMTVPLALLWILSPVGAWLVSRPVEYEVPELEEEDVRYVRRIARKTWRFFDTFVTAEDHWLAPDNFQEDPKGEVAHRTSPTNVGLQLLTYLTAADLGYMTVSDLVERVSDTLSTMAGMERFRGHFYNWYDTRTLQPLRPGYISTVDSGNLAGHLVALRVGLLEYSERPFVGAQTLVGIEDTLRVAIEDLNAERERLGPSDAPGDLREGLESLLRRVTLEQAPTDLGGWSLLLRGLVEASESVWAALEVTAGGEGADRAAVARVRDSVADALARIRAPLLDITTFARWARLLEEVPLEVRTCPLAADLKPVTEILPSLVGLAEGLNASLEALDKLAADPPGETPDDCERLRGWATAVALGIRDGRADCSTLLGRLRLQADIAREMWEHTDFRVLYDRSRGLFSIGFNTAEGRLDGSYYDMLASECRLASFVAIAKGDVPQEHWFRLGRPITAVDKGRALISWSASMFEYLMPLLVMRNWPETLLDETYRSVVRRQIQYGKQRGVPWGVSESAFNAKDADLTYQYQAFGVPGLGLKRGLSEDTVVAPYASVLALPIDPPAALANLRALTQRHAEGRFGYFESVDYTPGRVPAGAQRAVVKAYFAHHQGMSLVTLGNAVTARKMQERFHADPVTQSAELLLQERVPRHIELAHPHVQEVRFVRSVRELPPPMARSYPLANTPTPATHFLSNGRYSVMVTNAGGGYSRWEGIAVSRYREDVTRDCWGTFIYLRDLSTDRLWSATFQPTLAAPDDYHAVFSPDKAEFRRVDGQVETHTEVVVSPEDDMEVRRVTVANHGHQPLELELTSYFEVALTAQAADQAHKAFSNLFVETEALPDQRALLFTRRPRSDEDQRFWGVHVLGCERSESCDWSCETDRAVFVGRLGNSERPAAFRAPAALQGTVGPVLDPVCALRQTVTVPAGETIRAVFATGVGLTREDAVRLADKYRDVRSAQRAADMAWTTAQIELRDLGIGPDEAVTFQRLASRLLLTDPHSQLKVKTPVENGLPMSGLWPLGISGDLPILLVRIERLEDTSLVRQALLAHQYWRHSGLVSDLVVLNTKPTGYADELDARLHLLVRTGHALQLIDKPGGVFIRRSDQMQPDTLNLLLSVARATLDGDAGPIAVQLDQQAERPELPDPLVPSRQAEAHPPAAFVRPSLSFDNGYGGFDPEGGEYTIVLEDGMATPAPWVNVMGWPGFGTMVSEAGIGCTWALNSHENRLTTWNNDPVEDGSGETLYLRDEETGEVWSPTPLPIRADGPYVVRHGKGYSTFTHESHGLTQETLVFAAVDDPVRVVRVSLGNTGERGRRISVTQLVEWVLGSSRSRAQQLVVTWFDAEASMLTAHNHMNEDFPGRPAFLACDAEMAGYTGSRTEFLGRNGSRRDPRALRRKGLAGQTGRFHDTCGAMMSVLEIPPGETRTVSFLLGQTDDLESARDLVARYRIPGAVDESLARVRAEWETILGAVRVSTPDPSLDLMLNGNLLYQVLSSRLWGRTGLYQSSGAYGFRDQLQDVLATLYSRPDLARLQILEAARHQFEAGDVQHWWQPYSGRGVRTRISDDRHWLAYAVHAYLSATGDESILQERAPFLLAPELAEGQEDLYIQPAISELTGDLYEHCVAALESGRPTGPHGLPLIGGGDWNDGMNRVGHLGRGESVWLAWFLDVVLRRFAEVCDGRGDPERAASYRSWADDLVTAIEREAWDGAWYRRAYFDDGTPLGSHLSEECCIDAIAQAWAVISGRGDHERAQRAIQSVEDKLIRWGDRLVALLTPPFDRTSQDPGYIKGYVPGVRENGGQYTHAAVWVTLAYLLSGDGDEALNLIDLLNPVNHALDRESADVYKVEPYVLAADVYSLPPHVGRGGWTWYTGSASWFYRTAISALLGLTIRAEGGVRYLVVEPCIPKDWDGYSMSYRFGGAEYHIHVDNPRGVNRGVQRVELDGREVSDLRVPLEDDAREHQVRVTLLGG